MAASLAGVALALAFGAVALRLTGVEAARFALVERLAPLMMAVLAVVALVPGRWFEAVQLAGMALWWVAFRAVQWNSGEGPAAVAATAGAALLLFLPDSLPVRRAQVVVATLAIAALFSVKRDWERPVVGVALQVVTVAGCATRPTGWRSLARTLLAANVTQTTPVPHDDLQRVDRSFAGSVRGAAWFALAAPSYIVGRAVQDSPWAEPLLLLSAGQAGQSVVAALVLWFGVLLEVSGLIFLDAGLLRMLGLPVAAPVQQPWKSRDLLDYWRRANSWRYRMMVEGYQRLFFPVAGPWMPAGVLAVFLLSGLHHAAVVYADLYPWLRWTAEGLLCAGNAAWSQWRRRVELRRWLVDRSRPRRVPLWLAAFVVLVIHGYLQHLSRPSEPTRDVIRGWLGEG